MSSRKYTVSFPAKAAGYKEEREENERKNDFRISLLKRRKQISKSHEILTYRIQAPNSWADFSYSFDDFLENLHDIINFCPCISPDERIQFNRIYEKNCIREKITDSERRSAFSLGIKGIKCFQLPEAR